MLLMKPTFKNIFMGTCPFRSLAMCGKHMSEDTMMPQWAESYSSMMSGKCDSPNHVKSFVNHINGSFNSFNRILCSLLFCKTSEKKWRRLPTFSQIFFQDDNSSSFSFSHTFSHPIFCIICQRTFPRKCRNNVDLYQMFEIDKYHLRKIIGMNNKLWC